MDALAYEVQPLQLPFAIDNFKFYDPLEKKLMCLDYLLSGDRMLVDDSDCLDEHAEMRVKLLRENPKEDTRTLTIDIV